MYYVILIEIKELIKKDIPEEIWKRSLKKYFLSVPYLGEGGGGI